MPPMRRPAGAVALAGAAALAGCSSDLGAPDPATRQGRDVVDLWRTEFWIAAALGALVLALIGWCIVRYRRRPDDDGTLPVQRAGSIPLEVFYTAVPVLIVAGLFVYNLVLSRDVDKRRTPDVTIDVTGFQWQWRFEYPDDGVTVVGDIRRIPTMVMPAGRTVRLNLKPADVIHSFFVPGFLMKRDVVPGLENTIILQPTKTGTYLGHCAEFCGLDHARMNFDVRIVTPDEYESWLRQQANRT
jgi:cytochrome c oxidase subunit 2